MTCAICDSRAECRAHGVKRNTSPETARTVGAHSHAGAAGGGDRHGHSGWGPRPARKAADASS